MCPRREFIRTLAGGGAGALAFPYLACGPKKSTTEKKAIILGLDGFDPRMAKALMDLGRMPNFEKLGKMGVFSPLGTTMPALSPVAWSSFITGLSPGGHGIADFVVRDPETYTPFFSIWDTDDSGRKLSLGDYELPLRESKVFSRRYGKPFWAYLTEQGIPASVIKIPTNFPVEKTATRAVAGMGTPDVTDSFGTFNYFTTDSSEDYGEVSGGNVIHVAARNHRVETLLPGPVNSLKKPREDPADRFVNYTRIPFTMERDPHADIVRLDIQGHRIVLNKGEYSDWIHLNFDLIPHLAGVAGIARFYVKNVHPHLQLYVTPINIDPADQAMPVAFPEEIGAEIAEDIGPFWTKGLPSDMKAFDYGVINDEGYVKQAELILKERLALFDHEWAHYKTGLFYFYVSSTDQDAHMLWRNMDKSHPMHDACDLRYGEYLHHLYEQMDRLLGKVLPAVDDNTLVMICSDHGFAQFARQFHLNTWLRDQGYLVLKDSAKKKEKSDVFDIDWTKTAAYGIGFNGLYINQEGREWSGFIGPGKRLEICRRIRKDLEKIVDSETGERPIAKVYPREEVYTGEFTFEMPDLLVGYTPGYRSAASSVLGGTGQVTLDLNRFAWSGDHSMARDLVPGTLFSSRAIYQTNPNILDLPVTILDFFGIDKPSQMEGRSLFRAG